MTNCGDNASSLVRHCCDDNPSSLATHYWDDSKEIDVEEIERNGLVFTRTFTTKDYVCECKHVFKTRSVYKNTASKCKNTNTQANRIYGVSVKCNLPSQPGSEEYLLLDGLTTMWHTNWGECGKLTNKCLKLQFDLGDIYELDNAQYLPRKDAGNGTFLVVRYRVSIDGRQWSNYSEDIQFLRDDSWKKINVGGEKARFFELCVLKAVGDYGSGMEMVFFKKPGTVLITNEIKLTLKKPALVCTDPPTMY